MGLLGGTAGLFARGYFGVRNEISEAIAKSRRLWLTGSSTTISNDFGRAGAALKTVTADSAMSLSAFWATVKANAQAVSTMGLGMFEKRPDGSRESNNDHPLAEIIGESPNRDQTSLEFWESVCAWLLVNGNSCSEIDRLGKRVTALTILPNAYPHREDDGTLIYKYVDRGKSYKLPRDKVFHVKGFGFGGDSGLSAIQYGVQTFSTALAAFETSGRMFSNGMQASGLLTSDQVLRKEQRDQLQEIMKSYTGSDNAGKMMILEAGLKFSSLQLNPQDAQLLEQQRFSIEEICRWTGTPPIIIGHAPEGQTMFGTGIEQTFLAWLALGVNPLCERIERRITKQLLQPGEEKRVYAEFNREAFLQMDAAAKAQFLSNVTQNGLMSRNEGRAKLNLPKREGADDLTAQSNLLPLDKLGKDTGGNAAKQALLSWLGLSTGNDNEQKKSAAS